MSARVVAANCSVPPRGSGVTLKGRHRHPSFSALAIQALPTMKLCQGEVSPMIKDVSCYDRHKGNTTGGSNEAFTWQGEESGKVKVKVVRALDFYFYSHER